MYNISQIETSCQVRLDGGFPGGKDRATLKSDSTARPPAPSGCPPFFIADRDKPPDGVKAINFGGEAEGEGAKPPSSPCGFINQNTNCDNVATCGSALITSKFIDYKSEISKAPSLYLHLKNKTDETEAVYRVDRRAGSRYFPEGRGRMKKRLWKRLDGTRERGILMTCTVDTKRYDKLEAWQVVWESFKKLMDALNKYRQRNMNAKGSLVRVAVLEMTEQGYPHLHVFFPGLRYLIDDLSKLDSWWEMGGKGGVDVEPSKKRQSARGYVLKYIGKMSGWSEDVMAVLWFFGIRFYNLSHCYYLLWDKTKWAVKAVYRSLEEMVTSLGCLMDMGGIEALAYGNKNFVMVRSP